MFWNFCWDSIAARWNPEVIETGIQNVKRILAENYVRPDEAQKILSMLRQRGSFTVIDKITINLNVKKDSYEAEFSNLGIRAIPVSEEYPTKFDRLLCGGIWCIIQLEYEYIEEERDVSPIRIHKLTPIQMPHVDIEELKQGRKAFTQEEWMKILLRSIGMEPDRLKERERWLLLARMLPLVENNFNLCELGAEEHWQISYLQGNFSQQHLSFRWADDRCQLVLQYGPENSWTGGTLGLRGF